MLNAAKEFQKFANSYNEMMLDSWSAMTKSTIQSDAFAATAGAYMDWSLASHKMMTDLSGQVMESMDIPKRSDLARISAQVRAVEARLLEHEDQQDDIKELLLTLLQKVEQQKAPTAPSVEAKPVAEAPPVAKEPAPKKPAARKKAVSKAKATRKVSKKRAKKAAKK